MSLAKDCATWLRMAYGAGFDLAGRHDLSGFAVRAVQHAMKTLFLGFSLAGVAVVGGMAYLIRLVLL